MRNKIESVEFTILTYGGNTEEWEEANANVEENKKELSNQSELRLGLGGIEREIECEFGRNEERIKPTV